MIRVLFLAQLREQLKTAELQVQSESIENITALKQYLVQLHPEWENFLSNNKLMVAVNQAYAKQNTAIKSGDEVAFFPPVTGG